MAGLLKFIGYGLIFAALSIVTLTYGRLLFYELRFALVPYSPATRVISPKLYNSAIDDESTHALIPKDPEFGIVIPKIGANASIIEDVDPYNQEEYQEALTQGIAHAKDSQLPGERGNVFLFSHSSVDFYQAIRYNSIFYLIHKLKPEDDIYLTYKDELYHYQVAGQKIVSPDAVEYLQTFSPEKKLTLMTCWPPGTSLKRLLVEAELVED